LRAEVAVKVLDARSSPLYIKDWEAVRLQCPACGGWISIKEPTCFCRLKEEAENFCPGCDGEISADMKFCCEGCENNFYDERELERE